MPANFDVARIRYGFPQEAEKFAEKNAAFCAALNLGKRFSLVFTQRFYDEGQFNNWDLHYALVVLGSGAVMPYPVFEEAGDLTFYQEEWDFTTPAVLAAWMKERFGYQFVGIVVAPTAEKGEIRRRSIAKGARMARANVFDKARKAWFGPLGAVDTAAWEAAVDAAIPADVTYGDWLDALFEDSKGRDRCPICLSVVNTTTYSGGPSTQCSDGYCPSHHLPEREKY